MAGEFIQRRRGDRVGLVLFGSRAYLQTPLTFDTETTAMLLDESEIGLAGRETAIGDAIGLAVKRLREDAGDRAGADAAHRRGQYLGRSAAACRRQSLLPAKGLTIYTVGVGADEMMVQDFFGSRLVNPSADLDEDTLIRPSPNVPAGAYFRARDAAGLAQIYEILDELEPVESDVEVIRPVDELFYWPLAVAFLAGGAWPVAGPGAGHLAFTGRVMDALSLHFIRPLWLLALPLVVLLPLAWRSLAAPCRRLVTGGDPHLLRWLSVG